jgi:hypothetical protein
MHGRLEVVLRVTAEGYTAGDDAAAKQHAKLKVGSLVGARIARSRSIQQHRRYWKALECAVAATGKWPTPEYLHVALKEATGHFMVVRLMNGRMVKVPGSTAFDEMNHEQFTAYSEDALRILADDIGVSIEQLLDESRAA